MTSRADRPGQGARIDQTDVFSGRDVRGNELAKPWIPMLPSPRDFSPDYEVDSEARADAPHARPPRYRSVQAAIDRACRDAATDMIERQRVIHLCPGHYPGPFLVPGSGPAIALFGAGHDKVILSAGIDAQMTGIEFNTRFGPTIAGYGRRPADIFPRSVADSA